jgi:hypothetical protein
MSHPSDPTPLTIQSYIVGFRRSYARQSVVPGVKSPPSGDGSYRKTLNGVVPHARLRPLANRRWFSLLLLVGCWLIAPHPVAAQSGLGGVGTLGGVEPGGQYPSRDYYVALEIYRSGDLEEAIRAFDNAMRGTRKDIRGRWIDSIPVLAMLAECNWQLGDLAAVRQHVDHVFQIAIRNRGWLGKIDWQSSMQLGTQRAIPSGLWQEARSVQLAPVADKIMYRSGSQLTERRLAQGGVIEEPSLRTMDLVEIMRGLAIASYRRRVLLGPLAEQEPLSTGLLESTKYPAGLQVPIGRTLIGALRTTGYFSSHDDKRTITEANQSALYRGAAHPLSAITALAQASALAGTEKPDAVAPLALNIVHFAAALKQPELIGEAMQLAAGCASPQQAATIRQAANVVATALHQKSRLATLHCLVAGADASITAGDLDSATRMLAQAKSLASRRDVLLPRMEAYGAYVAARLAAARGSSFGLGKLTSVDEALSQMTAFTLNHRSRKRPLISMPRVYQLGLIRQAIGSSLGGNTSDKLLVDYCDDPPPEVWRRDAVDALASVMVDRSLAHAARVSLAASSGYGEKMLQATDFMLAARFNQRLLLGGRIAQVRTITRSDDQLLDQPAVEFRNKAGRGMNEVRAAALAMGEPNAIQVESLEAKACAVALSRMQMPMAMPPRLDLKLPVAALPKRTGLLTFIAVGNQLYATLAADGKVAMWTIAGSNRLPGEIGRLLKAIGVGKIRGNRLPEDESWKQMAVSLRRHLLPDDATITAERFDELIIVPDGPLWYLPFDILPLGDEGSSLIAERIRIRYAATPGLALKPVAMPPISRSIGVTADLFFAPRDPDANSATVQSVLDVLNDPVRLPETVDKPTGRLGNLLGHLVVAAPRKPNTKNQLMMSVAPYDQSSPYSTLAAWMRFPAEVPRSVVLIGFRTPVEVGQMGNGHELFQTLCALNAAGVRSVLLSRWAVGGESSAIVLRELLQELPFSGMNESWRRARMMLRRSELDPEAEPLLTQADHDRDGLTGNEPLFWASYMISSPDRPTAGDQ